jgi:hypothetical protein
VAKKAQVLLRQAIREEGEGYRLLLEGAAEQAAPRLVEAAGLYRASFEAAPPGAYGRLIGMLKTSLIAGLGEDEAAAYVREAVAGRGESPTSAYAVALAALARGEEDLARSAAELMASAPDAFTRTAEAVRGLADGDRDRYERALRAIVEDFEERPEHLTGVPIADTVLALERLAERRGLAAEPTSPVLPPG